MAFRLSQNAGGLVLAKIAEDEVEVWTFDLGSDLGESAARSLTAQEMRCARRIISPLARRRFIAGRTHVREVLSRYCDVPPSQVPLGQNRFGKPSLQSPYSGVSFNFSRSRGLAVMAVCTGRRIGVDIERRRPIAAAPIASTWLHDAEWSDLQRRRGTNYRDSFFRLWCRKEAVVKAEGRGLCFPLHEFRVSVSKARAEVLAWPQTGCEWHLRDLAVDERYAGAIATDRPVSAVRYRELG